MEYVAPEHEMKIPKRDLPKVDDIKGAPRSVSDSKGTKY